MTDLQHDVNRAARAKALIEDDLLAPAFRDLEAAYLAAWRASHVNDAATREKLFLAVNIIGKVKEHLQTIIANGKVAEAQLKFEAERAAHNKRHAR